MRLSFCLLIQRARLLDLVFTAYTSITSPSLTSSNHNRSCVTVIIKGEKKMPYFSASQSQTKIQQRHVHSCSVLEQVVNRRWLAPRGGTLRLPSKVTVSHIFRNYLMLRVKLFHSVRSSIRCLLIHNTSDYVHISGKARDRCFRR